MALKPFLSLSSECKSSSLEILMSMVKAHFGHYQMWLLCPWYNRADLLKHMVHHRFKKLDKLGAAKARRLRIHTLLESSCWGENTNLGSLFAGILRSLSRPTLYFQTW